MKSLHWSGLVLLAFFLSGCSSLPEPEKEPFSQFVDKAVEAPSGDGVVDKLIDDSASTFPKTKNSPSSSDKTPMPPRNP